MGRVTCCVVLLVCVVGVLSALPPLGERACPVKNICKRIRMVQKKLKKQTEAMTAQAKLVSGRLDASEAKINDIANIGKKLTDLLTQQGSKIQEQGAKLTAEETKLSDQLNLQMTTYTQKMETYTQRMTSLSESTLKLTDKIAEQDTKIGSLQTEGVKILDTLAGSTKKMEGKITAQTAKLGAKLPLPEGKFTEITKGCATCAEKMAAFQAKYDAMKATAEALKEKLSAAENKLGAIEDQGKKIAAKADATDAEIEAQGKVTAGLTDALKANEGKMGEIAAQGTTIADNMAAAAVKVGAVAAAKLKMKEKLGKQMEQANAIKEQALAVAGKMKDHESKLAKVQADLEKPKEPAPAAPAAAVVPPPGVEAPPSEAAEKAAEELEKMEENLKDVADMKSEPPLPVAFFADPAGAPLTKNNEVGFLAELPKIFDISFDVKPTAFAGGWHSIVHLTKGGNCCNEGQRIPGVWFGPTPAGDKNDLYVSFSVSGNGNNGLFTSKKVGVNEWISVRVNQKEVEGAHIYQIWQNNELFYSLENNKPEAFKDVTVFAADPWYAEQEGSIRNLVIDEKNSKEGLMGSWNVKFASSTAKYSFTQEKDTLKINVLDCSWNACKDTPQADVEPSKDDNFPADQGWLLSANIHYNDVLFYFNVDGDKMDVKWRRASSSYKEDGEGVKEDFSCTWTVGDGEGVSEVKIGDQTGDACVAACVAKKKEDPTINGVSIFPDGKPGCWCEQGMNSVDASDTKYKTCYLIDNKNPPLTFYGSEDGQTIYKNRQIGWLPTLWKTFQIQYDIKPTKFEGGWHSVIHMTVGGNCCGVGQRIPGIWFRNDKLMTSFSVSGNGNFWKWHGEDTPLDKWTTITISQSNEGGKHMYRVRHGEKVVVEAENTKPEDFKGVQIFMGDPWYAAQEGMIRNLEIKQL